MASVKGKTLLYGKLRSQKLPETHWESVLDSALHSIRSLLCTSTDQTPHERLFSFNRKSCNGYSLPTWLSSPGPILLRKFVRISKSDPLVERVELVSATPHYAGIRYQDGRESTVSTRDLAPSPRGQEKSPSPPQNEQPLTTEDASDTPSSPSKDGDHTPVAEQAPASPTSDSSDSGKPADLRRSTRVKKPADRLTYY